MQRDFKNQTVLCNISLYANTYTFLNTEAVVTHEKTIPGCCHTSFCCQSETFLNFLKHENLEDKIRILKTQITKLACWQRVCLGSKRTLAYPLIEKKKANCEHIYLLIISEKKFLNIVFSFCVCLSFVFCCYK